jgi:hypothetical protein
VEAGGWFVLTALGAFEQYGGHAGFFWCS